jgi:hypothetical protein
MQNSNRHPENKKIGTFKKNAEEMIFMSNRLPESPVRQFVQWKYYISWKVNGATITVTTVWKPP